MDSVDDGSCFVIVYSYEYRWSECNCITGNCKFFNPRCIVF